MTYKYILYNFNIQGESHNLFTTNNFKSISVLQKRFYIEITVPRSETTACFLLKNALCQYFFCDRFLLSSTFFS